MTRKLRVLIDTEASWLATGYSNYGNALLSRLQSSNKYEVAEFGTYASQNEGEAHNLPWKFYGNAPEREDKQGQERYNSSVFNQFGGFKFDQVCLDFRPDVVITFKDNWMYQHILNSPFADFYHKVFMPPVDAYPQQESWLDELKDVDGIFTYNDWSLDVLKQQAGDHLNLLSSAPPAAEPYFAPSPNKDSHKISMGLPADSFIVGTVMRNQKRKYIPQLISAFKKFLHTAPKDIAAKSFLYIHTTYPDIGWDFPLLLKEEGLASRVLWTYHCAKCNAIYFNLFQDARSVCKRCGSVEAGFPQVKGNIPREALVQIYNTFDIYIQYASNEGFGIPQIEAASVAVPVFSVDYSAMADVVRKLKGYPIKPHDFIRETESHRFFAVPDNEDLVDKMINFAVLPEPLRKKKAFETRQAYLKHYSYDVTAKKWMDFLDTLPVRDVSQTWESPPRIHHPQTVFPQSLKTAEQLVAWGMDNVLGIPKMKNRYLALRLIKDLNNRATAIPVHQYFTDMTFGGEPRYNEFTVQQAFEVLYQRRMNINEWERIRCKLG